MYYSLLTTYCLLLTTHYSLRTTFYLLLTTEYLLLTTYCSLPTTHYSLLNTHHSLLNTQYSIYNTRYPILTTHYSLLTTHYSLLTTHYSLESELRFSLASVSSSTLTITCFAQENNQMVKVGFNSAEDCSSQYFSGICADIDSRWSASDDLRLVRHVLITCQTPI